MTIRTFTAAAEIRNANVFGFTDSNKRHVMALLRGVQRALCSRQSLFLHKLENDLLLELESLLDQKEMLWCQKSPSEWIQLGDRNLSYFHKKAKIRKIRNRITSLKIHDGTWCDDEKVLKDEAVNFYKSLFSLDQSSMSASHFYIMFPDIDSNSLSHLDSIPSSDEIQTTLMGFVASTNSTAIRSVSWSRHYSMVSTKKISRPIVQNDCSKVISELSDGKSLNGYSVLIRNILSLCQRNWAIQFLWIPRAANQVVDKLFKQIAFPYFDMIRLDAPPDYLQSQLEQDNSSFHGFTVA
ncbi:hypothetical protein V6N13_113539 [Hibiscus sabdariffa]